MAFNPVFSFFYTHLNEAYNYFSDGEVNYGEPYAVIRHSRPFVIYQGTTTNVVISILGERSIPPERRVFLQKRGYRTGLLGWKMGGILGGSKLPGIEVTPVAYSPPSNAQRHTFTSTIGRLVHASYLARHPVQQTLSVHIPVTSGDGYFRLRITTADPRATIAVSPVFRVGSASWSSAQTQGASLLGLIPELAVRSIFITAKTAAYAFFYALFPFLKLAEYTPGPWRRYALHVLYDRAGGAALDERYGVSEGVQRARERASTEMYKRVPFGAVGVRTMIDVKRDEEMGRGGSWCKGPVV